VAEVLKPQVRLTLALDHLDARLPNGKRPALDRDLSTQAVLELRTDAGELKVVPEPVGTRGGYDDLRRAATREPLGRGLRLSVASLGDLARIRAEHSEGKSLGEIARGLNSDGVKTSQGSRRSA